MCSSQLARVALSHSSRSKALALLTSTPMGPRAAAASGRRAGHGGLVGEVGLEHGGAAALGGDAGRERVGLGAAVPAMERHSEPGLGERLGDGAAEALGAAGDEGGAGDGGVYGKHRRGLAGAGTGVKVRDARPLRPAGLEPATKPL